MTSILNSLYSIIGAIYSNWPTLALGILVGLILALCSKFWSSYNGFAIATLLVILSPFIGVDASLIRSVDLNVPLNPFLIGMTATLWVRFVYLYILRENEVFEKSPKSL